MSKKNKVLVALYELYKQGKIGETFTNEEVKAVSKKMGFANPFDATKIDHSKLLPKVMRDDDCFITHLGKGKHRFLKGIGNAYLRLEDLEPREFKYEKSLLNEVDSSESNLLFTAYNARLLHTFLYVAENATPRVYGGRRTAITVEYSIGGQRVDVRELQMEMDMTLEHKGAVTVLEAKNARPKDFAVYQLFMPFLYYNQLKLSQPIKSVDCCYITRTKREGQSVIGLYLYDFVDNKDMSSIRLKKQAAYKLVAG